MVVTLGNTALQALSGNMRAAIGQEHAKPATMRLPSGENVFLFPLYHPASIIYNRALEQVYRDDLMQLGVFMQEKGLI